MVRVPVAPGCVYFGFCPSSLVLTCALSARQMQWASMAMHYTASMPSMQAESDGKVKWNGKKKEYTAFTKPRGWHVQSTTTKTDPIPGIQCHPILIHPVMPLWPSNTCHCVGAGSPCGEHEPHLFHTKLPT